MFENQESHYRQIILDNYKNPSHKGLLKQETSETLHQKSTSCIDNIIVEVTFGSESEISHARFSGIGCAISMAASNIICSMLENKTISKGEKILSNYINLILHKPVDEAKLGDLICFSGVYKQPNRIKCATIAASGFLKIIENNQSR